MHAFRTIRLCTKDCLCLYCCPTGATDTETGQIDFDKCIGCGMCVRSCPSHAISLVPDTYPVQQPKTKEVCEPLMRLAETDCEAEAICRAVSKETDDPAMRQLMDAMEMSFRRQSEDIYRECGYMLPQSRNVRMLLEKLLYDCRDPSFPREAAERLLEMLQVQLR